MWVYFSHRNPYKKEQEKLAILLGINIKDYPYERAFPIGYFYKVLKPGMSISEIHGLVQGYEKVLRCSTGEPAYYYSIILELVIKTLYASNYSIMNRGVLKISKPRTMIVEP